MNARTIEQETAPVSPRFDRKSSKSQAVERIWENKLPFKGRATLEQCAVSTRIT